MGGFSCALNVLDAAMKYRACFPLKSLTAKDTAYALQHFRGDQKVKNLYSDKASNIEEACKNLDIQWEHSLPGVPQTNGKIVRANYDIVAGTRALLVQAGLPDCFWPSAATAYCVHANASVDDEGSSPWYKRFGKTLARRAFPIWLWRLVQTLSYKEADRGVVYELTDNEIRCAHGQCSTARGTMAR